ncbi:MAG: hypothetical protein K2X77_27565 [Candidatus Obscuribacterales bacterium]|nr:hypothetical protein [Candidatus Obscuribacterales bacterium]
MLTFRARAAFCQLNSNAVAQYCFASKKALDIGGQAVELVTDARRGEKPDATPPGALFRTQAVKFPLPNKRKDA